MIANKEPAKMKYIYIGSAIQKMGFPMSKSLMVPPPVAVANPIMIIPKKSKRLCIAINAPEMEKAKTPNTNMMVNAMFIFEVYSLRNLNLKASLS